MYYITNINVISISVCVVPEEIGFNPQTKRINEKCRRPELLHSSVEYIAPSEYMVIYYNNTSVHIRNYNLYI